MVSYQVLYYGNPIVLSALVVLDVRPDEMADGDEVRVRDRTMHIMESNGKVAVTYVDAHHRGYMFFAPELSVDDLVRLVGHTDLVGPEDGPGGILGYDPEGMDRRALLFVSDAGFRTTLTKQLGRYRVDIDVQPDADRALATAAKD